MHLSLGWTIGIIIALAVVVIAGYALFIALSISHAVKETNIIISHTTPYEQHPANPTSHILVAGDSTGYGTGADIPQHSLAGRLGADVPDADITNISINGLRLAGLQDALRKLPSDAQYDLIVLQIGANDIVNFTPKKDIQSSLADVLAFTDAHSTNTIVITSGNVGGVPFFYWPLNWIYTYRTNEVRAIFIAQIAQHPQASYVDLVQKLKGIDLNSDIPKYYAADHFHPSATTYGLWYDQLKPFLPTTLDSK